MKNKEKLMLGLAAGIGAATIAGVAYKLLAADIPDGAMAVQPFEKERYMGLWNEIARLPNRIEKDISQLTEEYILNDDGTMAVITRGYNFKKAKWSQFSGKMKMAGNEFIGMMQVSYFWPVYLSYNVLMVDDDYKYAMVSGSGLDYLWILSKEQTIPKEIKGEFLTIAAGIGFDVDKLEWL